MRKFDGKVYKYVGGSIYRKLAENDAKILRKREKRKIRIVKAGLYWQIWMELK